MSLTALHMRGHSLIHQIIWPSGVRTPFASQIPPPAGIRRRRRTSWIEALPGAYEKEGGAGSQAGLPSAV